MQAAKSDNIEQPYILKSMCTQKETKKTELVCMSVMSFIIGVRPVKSEAKDEPSEGKSILKVCVINLHVCILQLSQPQFNR